MAALLVSLAGARRLSFDTDVLSLLPRDGRVIQSFRTFLARFGSLDQLYVVFTAPDGHAIAEYDDEIDGVGRAPAQRAGDRARRRRRRRSHAAISAGSPTTSCCCCATASLDEALQRLTARGDAGTPSPPAASC